MALVNSIIVRLLGASALALPLCAFQSGTPSHPTSGPGQAPGGAHPVGGHYGGPGDTLPPATGSTTGPTNPGTGATPTPGTPQGPGSGDPLAPGGATPPRTPPRSMTPLAMDADPAAWETWWGFNRDRFLHIKQAIYRRRGTNDVSGTGTAVADPRPDAQLLGEVVEPALLSVLADESDPELVSEALLAVARVDAARARRDVLHDRVGERITQFLSNTTLAISEAATLALGVHGRPAGAPRLAALLEDSKTGRELCGRAEVPWRIRSAAAYGLGLVAQRSGTEDVARYAVHALARGLETDSRAQHDVQAACVVALGLARITSGVANDGELPAAASIGALVASLERVASDTATQDLLRAQAAAALGRVGDGTPEPVRARAIAWCITALEQESVPPLVKQALVIALGRLGQPTDMEWDRSVRARLAVTVKDSDRLLRGLALIAAGEIGARARSEPEKEPALELQRVLISELERGKSGTQGFAAIGLGIFAHDSAWIAAADGNAALRAAISRERGSSEQVACVLALGLRLDATSAPLALERMAKDGDDGHRGSAALALGLAGAREGLPALRATLDTSTFRPQLLRDSAIALALLGDPSVGTSLMHTIETTKSLGAVAAACDALGVMGDASVLPRLAQLAQDREQPTSRRARIVKALGAVGDTNALPWAEPFAEDVDYAAGVETLTNAQGTGVADRR